jgi:hypothetical protein
MTVAPQRFGPFRHGLAETERVAELRSIAALVAIYCGSSSPAVMALREAESDATASEAALAAVNAIPSLMRRRLLSVFGSVTWPSKRASAPMRNNRRAARHAIMETTMRMSDAFRGKFFRAADVQDRPIVLTIQNVEFETMNDGASKPVARFAEDGRGLVLNKANYSSITQIAGSDDTIDWRGLRIVLFAGTAEYSGATVPAVRIRKVSGAGASATAPGRGSRDDIEDSIPF